MEQEYGDDYVVGNEEMREKIRKLEIGEGVESDHPHRMIVAMEGVGQERRRAEKKRRKEEYKMREGIRSFMEEIGKGEEE